MTEIFRWEISWGLWSLGLLLLENEQLAPCVQALRGSAQLSSAASPLQGFHVVSGPEMDRGSPRLWFCSEGRLFIAAS